MTPLMTAKEVGAYLKVSPRVVAEKYVFMPNFPKAIRLPSAKGQGVYRWKPEDIVAWVDAQVSIS